MKRFLFSLLTAAVVVGVFSIGRASVLYDRTVRIVDNLGNVLSGVASATVAPYDMTVRVVDQNGKVQSSLGGSVAVPEYVAPVINNASGNTATLNNTSLFGFVVPWPVTVTHFVYDISTADNSNFSDEGVYGPCVAGSACPLLFDIGQFKSASTGMVSSTILQNASCTGSGTPGPLCTGSGQGTNPTTPFTLQPGLYFLGQTSAAATQVITCSNANGTYNFYGKYTSQGATTNGILLSSITAPSSLSGTTACNINLVLGP